MKFIYQYRTKDNVSHRGVICAANRDAAYAALKSQGVKPGRMEEAPGFFNKFFGKGKRWIAIAVLALSTVALAVILFTREEVSVDPYSDKGFARPIERRQIWGDEVVVDAATQSNWREVFDNPAERMLAMFAQPGKAVKIPVSSNGLEEQFKAALAEPTRISDEDLEEYKQMKCIVAGMKNELREYLAAGGKVATYVIRLVERQNAEIRFAEHERKTLEAAAARNGVDVRKLWREANLRLRAMGLQALEMPKNKK